MDLADLQFRARAQREFAVACDHASFTLRRPYPFDVALAERRARESHPPGASIIALERALLRAAIVGWEGVNVSDVLEQPPEPDESLPWHADAVELLLNARPEWASQLSTELFSRLAAAREAQESAAKN